MDKYNVIITPDAAADLTEIKQYIAVSLNEPQTALKYIRALRERIEALDTIPKANALVSDEPWHSRGLRKVIYKNFFIYYIVDDSEKNVYILNVVYARRDQLAFLSK